MAAIRGDPEMGVRLFIVFFFFQAEDGIRDVAVTGVQTCALPISEPQPEFVEPAEQLSFWGRLKVRLTSKRLWLTIILGLVALLLGAWFIQTSRRSEERRVGKRV